MSKDHLTTIMVSGFRALADVTVELRGLTVLIGENGAGKSTLIEAFELLRKAPRPGLFASDVIGGEHGGFAALLRRGSTELALGVEVEGDGPVLRYRLALAPSAAGALVRSESLDLFERGPTAEPLHVIARTGADARVFDQKSRSLVKLEPPPTDQALLIAGAANTPLAQPALRRLALALEDIDVHVGWDTRPLWAGQGAQARAEPGMRLPVRIDQAPRVERLGGNLSNCLYALRNRGSEVWAKTIETARLGLGVELSDIMFPPQRSSIGLDLVFTGVGTVPASALSEGQLAYLATIALSELGASRSAVVIDEPELHMHPGMIPRAVGLLEALAAKVPVVVATHSDRFLDSLAEPADAALLCELDANHAALLVRPDKGALASWLEEYRGIGHLRSEGYEAHVFARSVNKA